MLIVDHIHHGCRAASSAAHNRRHRSGLHLFRHVYPFPVNSAGSRSVTNVAGKAFPESSTVASDVSSKSSFARAVDGDTGCVNNHVFHHISLSKQQAFQQSCIPYEIVSVFCCFPSMMKNLGDFHRCVICSGYAYSRKRSSRHDP